MLFIRDGWDPWEKWRKGESQEYFWSGCQVEENLEEAKGRWERNYQRST